MMSVMIGSRPVLGSSNSRISGLCAMARAKPTRRRMPPESSDGRLAADVGQLHELEALLDPRADLRRRPAGAPQRKGDVVVDGHRVEERALLERHAELLAQRRCARTSSSVQRSWPSTKTSPESGRSRPMRCLRSTLLPGPGRAHDDERLPGGDGEVRRRRARRGRRRTCAGPPPGAWPSAAPRGAVAARRSKEEPREEEVGQQDRRGSPTTTACVVERPDALRAALGVVAAHAGHHREDQAEDGRLDEAGR